MYSPYILYNYDFVKIVNSL